MSLIDAITGLEAASDEYHGAYKDYKIRYINGVISGNESLIKAFDDWEALNNKSTNMEIINANGNFVYELLKRSNDITEDQARLLATPEATKEMASIWWQKPTAG